MDYATKTFIKKVLEKLEGAKSLPNYAIDNILQNIDHENFVIQNFDILYKEIEKGVSDFEYINTAHIFDNLPKIDEHQVKTSLISAEVLAYAVGGAYIAATVAATYVGYKAAEYVYDQYIQDENSCLDNLKINDSHCYHE